MLCPCGGVLVDSDYNSVLVCEDCDLLYHDYGEVDPDDLVPFDEEEEE